VVSALELFHRNPQPLLRRVIAGRGFTHHHSN